MFPLFECFKVEQKSTQDSQTHKKITIHQYETGLFAKYEFEQNDFLIDKLTFGIQTIGNIEYLNSIIHHSTGLKFVKSDTMIRGGIVFV